MAFLDIKLDELPESKYSLIPEGWYQASITEVELADTKDKTGQKLSVKFAILGPTQQGRSIFANINIKNNSQKAEEIGRAQLGDLMRAIGLTHASDTDQFIGGNLQIKVAIKPPSTNKLTGEQYDEKNEVKGYKALGDGVPEMAAAIPSFPKPAAATPKAPKAASVFPWEKK